VSFTVLLDNYISAYAQMMANRRILASEVATQQVGHAVGAGPVVQAITTSAESDWGGRWFALGCGLSAVSVQHPNLHRRVL
jgi:hypothetical protein